MSDTSGALAASILRTIQVQTPYDGPWHLHAKADDGAWVAFLMASRTVVAADEVARLVLASPRTQEYWLVPAAAEAVSHLPFGGLFFRGVRPEPQS